MDKSLISYFEVWFWNFSSIRIITMESIFQQCMMTYHYLLYSWTNTDWIVSVWADIQYLLFFCLETVLRVVSYTVYRIVFTVVKQSHGRNCEAFERLYKQHGTNRHIEKWRSLAICKFCTWIVGSLSEDFIWLYQQEKIAD